MAHQVLRSYKYRIYPTKVQAQYLNQVFGSVRFVWNQLVANFNSYSKDGPNRPLNEKILKDNPEFSWLNDSISYALQQKRMDFEETKKQLFSKTRKVKIGRMKFKKKGVSKDSFRIPGQQIGFNKCINFETNRLKITKMTPIKMKIDRKFSGQLRSVTVSKNKCEQYFVSVLVEEEIELKQNTGRSIGIDLGLSNLMILSNGMKIDNPKWFRKSQAKLKRAQQHFSRKQIGSNRRNRQRLKVAKIYQKITAQRNYVHHVLSSWIVENYDVICMENLNIKGLMKNRKLAKSIQDASWSSLVLMIKYKSNWYGKTFHQIDRFFASSKTCSSCGHKMDEMNLSIREWTCPNCGEIHDRDINAAQNILCRGLGDLYGITSAELSDYRHGEVVRPEVEIPKASSVKCLINFIDFYKIA